MDLVSVIARNRCPAAVEAFGLNTEISTLTPAERGGINGQSGNG